MYFYTKYSIYINIKIYIYNLFLYIFINISNKKESPYKYYKFFEKLKIHNSNL